MSVIRRALLVIVAFLLFIQLLPAPPAHANETIVFGDPVLEQAIRTELSLPSGPITVEDMEFLQELGLPYEGNVQSLQGLEYAVNLRKLYADYNAIEDLTPLAGLSKLTHLFFSNNRIADLSPLASLTKLEMIELYKNYIDVYEANNQAVIAGLQLRGVVVSGLHLQQYTPKLAWTTMFNDTYVYSPEEYAYGNGVYVTPEQYTSTDGVHWTRHESDDEDMHFHKVVFGKGLFLGIGLGSSRGVPVWTSKDGVNWSTPTVIQMGANFTDVVFTGKRFVVISSDSNEFNWYDGVLATSEDGLTWKVHPKQLESTAHMLAWGNGVLLAITDKSLYKSTDGLVWKKVPLQVKGTLNRILYANGTFVITANQALLSSKDGTKWNVTSAPSRDWLWLVWVKDRYFVSSREERGKTVSYMTSKDGKTWSALKIPDQGMDIIDIKLEESKFVARSFWGHYASDDGVTWKQTKKIARMPIALNRSTVGDGKLVAVGGYSSTWGYFRLDASGQAKYHRIDDQYEPLNDVIWTGKQYWAVGGDGLMMTSKDGASWKKAASPTTESLTRIIRANDTYYVTGTNGLLMSSKDLVTWKKLKSNTKLHLVSIAWNGKKFVAVGEDMLETGVLTSDNGTDWKKVYINTKSSNGSPDFTLTDVAWGNGTFVITARQIYHTDLPYTVYVSPDGAKWTKVSIKYETTRERNWTPTLFGVHYTGEQFVVVGNNGSVYLSKDGKKWGREEIPEVEQLFFAQAYNGKLYVGGLTDQVYVGEFKR